MPANGYARLVADYACYVWQESAAEHLRKLGEAALHHQWVLMLTEAADYAECDLSDVKQDPRWYSATNPASRWADLYRSDAT